MEGQVFSMLKFMKLLGNICNGEMNRLERKDSLRDTSAIFKVTNKGRDWKDDLKLFMF